MSDELFDAPFNLAGELIDNGVTAEGEARVRALAQAEARKAQSEMWITTRWLDGHKCEMRFVDGQYTGDFRDI